jgi:ribosomal protein S18 acetylase RimI-like enzyme
MTVRVRDASPDDLDGIVEVFLACWRGSYSAVLPPALIERMTDAGARTLWATAFAAPAGRILVAEVASDGEARLLGVTRVALENPAAGTVESLYVSPLAQGAGVGKTLLRAAVATLAESGATTARLWVFDANRPSIDFYRSQGWAEDGENRVEDAYGEPERRMSRLLPAGSDAR